MNQLEIVFFLEESMEQFLTTFSTHVTSFLNLKSMKWVNTGDKMMDMTMQMMLSTLTAGLVTLLLTMYKNKDLLYEFIFRMKVLLKLVTPNPLHFNPSLTDANPKNGKAFMYSLSLLNLSIKYAFIRWFMQNHSNKYTYTEKQDTSLILYVMDAEPTPRKNIEQTILWKIAKGVYIPVWKDTNGYWVYMTTDGNDIRSEISLKSDSYEALQNCLTSIHKFVADIVAEEKAKPTQELNILEVDSKVATDIRTIGKISKNKTFDTLFFEQKEKILPILSLFKEGKMYPSHIPIDNKLGIILYGPPGTGKTAFISALANYLNRHVILVDMTKIKTQAQWNYIFRNTTDKMNIYVFEEFDCMSCIQKREPVMDIHHNKDEKSELSSMMMMMAMNNNESNKVTEAYKKQMDEKNDTIDLGFILRKLDGIESTTNRIIVATTNHPERIDPALLRPGRFGLHVHLKKANHKVICDMLNMIYETSLTEDDVYEIEEYAWGPAEILQNSLQYPCVKEYLRFLRMAKPIESF